MKRGQAVGLAIWLAAMAGAGAASADVEATLAAPLPAPVATIIDGRVWRCEGEACRGMDTAAMDSQPEARACARAAAELGAFTAYAADGASLPADKLAACNKRAKPAGRPGG